MSASWDLDLIKASLLLQPRKQLRWWAFSPMVILLVMPAGVGFEGSGEDPYLGGTKAWFKVIRVRTSLSHTVACVKHFALYEVQKQEENTS
jgi:beta-glucosidase-like glycosyl hydrolase